MGNIYDINKAHIDWISIYLSVYLSTYLDIADLRFLAQPPVLAAGGWREGPSGYSRATRAIAFR